MSHNPNNLQTHQYREKQPRPPLDIILLVVSGVLTVLMAFFAVLGLSPETGMAAYAKAAVVGVMAGGVSFAVNYFAIDRGAPLAATGYYLATIFSVVTILLVGAGLSASTFAGMTVQSTNILDLNNFADSQTNHVGNQIKKASEATRTLPVIRSISADLRTKVDCEIRSACLSGRGGGRGRVTNALENIADRADQISLQLEQGDRQCISIIATLNKQLGNFQSAINDTDFSLTQRRQTLVSIDAKIDQALSDLSEAVPTTLLSAYAGELASGVSIAERPQASKTTSAVLANHARTLESVLGTLSFESDVRPKFPVQAGVSSTFAYISHFLPIAAIVTVVELVLPLTLWVYTYLAIVWDKERATRNESDDLRSNSSASIPQKPRATKTHTANTPINKVVPLRQSKQRNKRRNHNSVTPSRGE